MSDFITEQKGWIKNKKKQRPAHKRNKILKNLHTLKPIKNVPVPNINKIGLLLIYLLSITVIVV